jgi:hypothetical protein
MLAIETPITFHMTRRDHGHTKERKDTGMSYCILLCRCTRLVNVGLIDTKSKLTGILAVKFTSYLLVSVVNAGGSNSHLAGSSSFVGHN